MSCDAKVWRDKEGWHGISDFIKSQLNSSEYGFSDIITYIEDHNGGQAMRWEIELYDDGEYGLVGYIA